MNVNLRDLPTQGENVRKQEENVHKEEATFELPDLSKLTQFINGADLGKRKRDVDESFEFPSNKRFHPIQKEEKDSTFTIPSSDGFWTEKWSNSRKKQNNYCPETPRKNSRAVSRTGIHHKEELQNIFTLNNQYALTTKKLKINGTDSNLTRSNKGSFVQTYSLTAEKSLVEGVDNKNLLLKLFLTKHEMQAKEYMQNSLRNYDRAMELNLPCSKIYNREKAIDDGYYLVQKIENELDLDNEHQIKQVCDFFKASFDNQYPCDLSYSNLRADSEGKVFLTDFVEKGDLFLMGENKQRIEITHFLKTWKQELLENKARSLLERFKQVFCSIQPEWINEALK